MKEIKIGRRATALIDDEDFEFLNQFKWQFQPLPDGNGEAFVRIPMHQMIMQTPFGQVVDHRDSNRLNNQKYNLRNCTQLQNIKNQRKPKSFAGKQTSSKFKGVSWNKRERKWEAAITNNRRRINLGRFTIEKEAAKAYNQAAILYHGDFARLNEI